MWIFTQDGFVSAVDNKQSPGKLTVRSRDRKSLKQLSELTGAEIIELSGRDYEYRVYVTREEFSDWLTAHIANLDYGNFKSRIHKTRGDAYYGACGGVWNVMHEVSDKYGAQRD